MRSPAVLPAVALGLGTAAGIFLPHDFTPIVPAVVWLAALAAFALRRDLAATATLCCGFLLAGAWFGTHADEASTATPLKRFFERHVQKDDHQLFLTVEGRLRTDAARTPSGVTLSVLVERLRLDGVWSLAPGGAQIGVGGELMPDRILQWRAGRRVAFPATLRKPARYLNWSVRDTERQLAWRGTSLVGSVKSARLVDVVADGTSLDEALASVRAEIRRAVASAVAPWGERSAAIVTAILIGDRAGLTEDVERRLQEAGTYHVIAISGGNIAILAGLCLWIVKLLRAGPRVSSLVVIVMLSAYAMIVEGGSSVRRATLMAVIYFGVRIFDQAVPPLNVAALVASVLLCVDPLQVVDPGYMLTFGATMGIVIGMSGMAGSMPAHRLLQALMVLVIASLCAEIALLPVSAFVFNRVTVAGLLVNLAAVPLMTVIQVAGMAAVALTAASADLALWAGWLAHLAVEGLIGSAAVVDLMPWLTWRVAPPLLVVASAYYLSIGAALLAWPAVPSRFRQIVRRAACLAASACALWIAIAPARAPDSADAPLRVTFLDVGQGDAAVVQFPNGRTLSIDAGGVSGPGFDIGARVVSPALWGLGIRRLDYMSVTHGDVDHIGGTASVFRDFRPSEVWDGVPVPPHRPTQELRAIADAAGATWRTLQPGDRAQFGNVELAVHHPPRPNWERQRVRNDDSEVLEIRYGGVSFVFSGDIGREVEHAIAPSFDRAPIRVLKVPHHGSSTSSSHEFLRALRPDVAVISAGRGNPFGHPVAGVVERYRQLGAAVYRTDQDGATMVETDGTTMRVRTFKGRRLTLTTYGR